MIGKAGEKGKNQVDDKLLLSVLSGAILAILLWICILVIDIQTDLKEIHNTLDIIEETLEQNSVQLDKINKHLNVSLYNARKLINE